MQIIKYELNKKNMYNVFLSNGEVITLCEKVITENELLLKKDIDKELYNKLINDNNIYEYTDMCIKYISIRLRSIKEIKEYLVKKKADINIIDNVIDKLIKLNYLNDDRFTNAYIKDKLMFTNYGDYKIRMELNRLGIDECIINKYISNLDDNVIYDRIRKTIDKDIRTNKKYSGVNLKNKIYNHLVSQGYSKDKILYVINEYEF